VLEWVIETEGFDAIPLEMPVVVSDEELEQRLDAFLTEHPLSPTRAIRTGVQGSNDRITTLLKTNAKYDSIREGNAILWFHRGTRAQG
jgi:hypothetical protein